ncbi:ATP-binding protein [Aquihabitans daechungensis]|uniref:HAMP domain-containing sensor histidine kinase n=1 Tax=Aquihabitans daechungensis TaxID=1052257 RepID=UPI003B9F6342
MKLPRSRQRAERPRPRRRPRWGLRTRATIGFGATGFAVALVLAAVTYGLSRNYLVDQRQAAAEQQTYVNARLARTVLRTPDPDVPTLLSSLGGGAASDTLLRHRGEWFSTTVTSGPDTLPQDLVRVVSNGRAGQQLSRDANGDLRLAVGVPIAAVDGSYFELFALDELDRTLDLLARSLAIGVAAAAIAAAAVGRAAAARLVRPLAPIADAAERIADGALDTRLVGIDDPDLRRLAGAFNTMAGALEERIEREARFAADVSHELRSPLTAVAASVEIIGRRREQLPPQVSEAYTVLAEKVETFQRMVLDLLEISQLDAGTATVADDLIDLHHLLPRLLARYGAEGATVTFQDDAPTRVSGDRRRLAQAFGNIVENAGRYAGGTTAVTVSAAAPGMVRLTFDDRGPGVPADERDAIFGRFARGEAGKGAGAGSGTGLGLSLVVEHLRLHHGRVWVEDGPAGGARFVIELPAVAP